MRNKKLIPFEIIEKAVAGEPEAIELVLQHYIGHALNICPSIKGISTAIFKIAYKHSLSKLSCNFALTDSD